MVDLLRTIPLKKNDSPYHSSAQSVPRLLSSSCFLFLHEHHEQEASWGGKDLFSLHFPHCSLSPKDVRTGIQAGQEAGADAEATEGCYLLACLLPLACSASLL